jgi:hypothetical protein
MLAKLLVCASFCLCSLGTVSTLAVAAQEGTPAAETVSCTAVEPRDAAFFDALAATPAADSEQGTPTAEGSAATPGPFTMPEGEAGDEAVVAEVTALYQQLIACLNAGDYLRAYALYSDEYLIRNLREETIAALEATPVPTEASQQSEFGSVLDARLLEDGRIAALVTTSNPQSGDVVLFAILRRDEDRLLIDEEQVVEMAMASPVSGAATPAA